MRIPTGLGGTVSLVLKSILSLTILPNEELCCFWGWLQLLRKSSDNPFYWNLYDTMTGSL